MDQASWANKAAALKFEVRPLIDGVLVDSISPAHYPCINPATEQRIANAPEGAAEDVAAAVASARGAYIRGEWSRTAPQVRRDVLFRLAQSLVEHREELALLDSVNVGKPISQALSEVEIACAYLRFAAEACDKLLDHVHPSQAGVLALNVREPVGVVGAILPWNFPMVVVAMKIAPALACGNSVVLKPSELSPLSAIRIGKLALQAGIPPGVLNIVPGIGATVGHAIAAHSDIDMLTFTGSTSTGRALLQASGQSNLKKLLLECGGKSPHIVFADAAGLDLDLVADDVVEQITWNQGQVCIAGSRLLVERSIHAELVERVVERMNNIKAGDPLDPVTTFGPMVSREHLAKVTGYIDAARSAGVQLRAGGRRIDRRGYFVQPTLFDEVDLRQPIACEEIFGPVLSVIPFRDIEHAMAIAHSVTYGLSARIWSQNVANAYALARQLRAGEVTVNAGSPASIVAGPAAATEPFGQSGFGIEGGLEGLRQYTRCKAIHINLPAAVPL